MKASVFLRDPEELEVTIAMTLPLRIWRKLRAQLVQDYPSWQFYTVIGAAIDKACASFTTEETIER